MARADSLIFFLTGFAQLIIASEIETALVAAILQGTGSGMLALGVYFLIFVARNHKEFSDRYSKSEKTVLVRDPVTGKLSREDATPAVSKAMMYGGPTALTFLAALFWLAN
tara:strand:- start:2 stop:334 length:333 start_codon:yes stop_codon:yes gene_type:complete